MAFLLYGCHLGKASLSVRSALYYKRNSAGVWPELGKELVGGKAEARRYERERRWLQIRQQSKGAEPESFTGHSQRID